MDNYVTGGTVKALREKKKLTQKQLADILAVSDKAVSKWETGRGLPDITLIQPLAAALGVSVSELLSGQWNENRNRSGNMSRSGFYVCPICGNVIHALGEGAFSCCGVNLPKLEAEECDESHDISVELADGERYVTIDHPMTKEHYISFIAFVGVDSVKIVKLYPEQSASARFAHHGGGTLYAYCNRHGLIKKKL